MNTLFRVNINWSIFFVIAFLGILIPNLNIYTYLAVIITLHQFFLLFYSVGSVIPIRYLFGSMMCLQLLLGPTLAYNVDVAKLYMKISQEEYFSYAIPAVVSFIAGLHITSKKLEGEVIDVKEIILFVASHKLSPFILIGVGFISSIISQQFSADLAFVFYLLGGMKYIGVFMILLGNKKLKPIPLAIVYGSIIASSLSGAMFHDLITWLIFLGVVFAIKYKPSVYIKAAFAVIFIILILVIQGIKKDYRTATWEEGKVGGLETLASVYEENQYEGGVFTSKTLAKNIVRINQGYIVTNVMKTVPAVVPFSNGEELIQILTAAVLPRIVAPNKLKAGDQELFIKYTGLQLRKGTSMGLSSVGDAYVNFGIAGGCIFMLFLGILYSESLKIFHKYSKYFPTLLLFTPLVFYYPIRPDCELQTILGHFVKSCFLVFVIFLVWKKYFKVCPQHAETDFHPDPLVPSSL